VAVQKKLAGTVIDGVCRDVDGIRELNYPMFTKGYFMVTGKDRVELQLVNEPIALCNIKVRPGDLIMADQSGVLVIPADKAENALGTALFIHHAEEKIVGDVKMGSTLLDARNKYNYSALQRKDK
jgi:4-hydroxy-4-methyl-2-oxoglutarate aldolase